MIFKRDFVPTLQEFARFLGANLPKFILIAKNAFIFFGRVLRGLWDFTVKFLVPGFNFLYRVFVDDIIPIVQKVWKFFGQLFDTLFGGIGPIGSLKDALIGMIPQVVLDAWEGLKTKAKE